MQHVSVEEEAKGPRIPPTNMVKTSENPVAPWRTPSCGSAGLAAHMWESLSVVELWVHNAGFTDGLVFRFVECLLQV